MQSYHNSNGLRFDCVMVQNCDHQRFARLVHCNPATIRTTSSKIGRSHIDCKLGAIKAQSRWIATKCRRSTQDCPDFAIEQKSGKDLRLPILLAICKIQLNCNKIVKQERIAWQSKELHQNPEKSINCLGMDIRLRSQNPKPWQCRHNLLQSWGMCIAQSSLCSAIPKTSSFRSSQFSRNPDPNICNLYGLRLDFRFHEILSQL